jgi:hypothetical protein
MAETGCVCGDVFKTTTVLFAIRCTAELYGVRLKQPGGISVSRRDRPAERAGLARRGDGESTRLRPARRAFAS